MAQFTPMTDDKLAASIALIGKSSQKLRDLIQKAAVNAIYQSIAHRNVTPMNDLFKATAKGIRRDALVRFLETNGNAAFVTADKSFKFYEAFELSADDLVEYCDGLMALAWEDSKPEKVESVYDVADMVEKLIKKAEKAAKDASKVEHAELITELKDVMRRYHAAQYNGVE